ALALLLAACIIHNSVAIAFGALVDIILIFALESRAIVQSGEVKSSLKELAEAIIAVVIIFVLLMLILQTTSPIDVVASCSMLPSLTRGEMVVLHGIPNMSSFLASTHVPVVNVSSSEFNKTLSNFSSEFLSFWAYNPNNRSEISNFMSSGYAVGLYNTECLDRYSEESQPYNYYKCFVPESEQKNNLIRYNYSIDSLVMNGTSYEIVETSGITIGNTAIAENYSNPIIVYRTNSSDSFPQGDIIHRLVAAIKVNRKYYLLTKGDNNEGLDIQYANYPPSANAVVGYYVGGLPYLGYLRLIIIGAVAPIPQCGEVIQHIQH
ncbi:MAG: hypothetical protein QXF01_02650, partial [Candidatus Micrarchaeaceae archaeon]